MSTTPPTGGGGESEDNSSSVNNISSLVAERGTGSGTTGASAMEEEFDESSIEALNWSEADEEELQLQHVTRKRHGVKNKSPVVKKVVLCGDGSIEGELAAAAASLLDQSTTSTTTTTSAMTSSSSPTVRMLSSSLLQSIASSSPESAAGVNKSKKEVIESWASEVNDAADRGEMEVEAEQEQEEQEDDEDDDDDIKMMDVTMNESTVNVTLRKRKTTKNKPKIVDDEVMTTSLTTGTTLESGSGDQSNAPVLDDGPIWNKGPKRYRFTENRRINQKLTFCVLIAVVLAVGLGLGNLVAYNECETEYKSQQKSASVGDPPLPQNDDEAKVNSEVKQVTDPVIPEKVEVKVKHVKPDIATDREQYTAQMQTLSKIVQTLDSLQRKIDNFENHTRRMGGVVVMKENDRHGHDQKDDELGDLPPETRLPSQQNFDDYDDHNGGHLVDEGMHPFPSEEEEEEAKKWEEADEEAFVLDLIDGIEETVDYLTRQDELKHLERLEKRMKMEDIQTSQLFSDSREKSPEELDSIRTIEASLTVFKTAHEAFIHRERDELREQKILGLAEERRPEDYSDAEKTALKSKYDTFMEEYPFKAEIDVEKERLKFLPNGDNHGGGDKLDSDIDSFFKQYKTSSDDGGEDDDETLLDIQSWMSTEQETDDEVKGHLEQVVPAINEEKEIDLEVTSAVDPEVTSAPPKELEPEPKRIPKKGKKSKKSKKSRDSESSSEFGSGNGNRRHKKKRQESNDKKSDDKKKQRSRSKSRSRSPPPPPPPKRNYNVNFDLDSDDDDDHKRRRYKSSSGDETGGNLYHETAQNRKKEDDVNWLLERTKVRAEMRDESAEGNQGHHNNKKAKNNWQLERDRIRRSVRSKNEKIKSFNNY